MKKIIRYYYKDAMISESFVDKGVIVDNDYNRNPPSQPANWDRFETQYVEEDYVLSTN